MNAMRFFTGFSLVALAACGGGADTTTTTTPPPSATTYLSLASTTADASVLKGVSQTSNGSTGNQFLVTSTGQLQHDTGVLTLTNGGYSFTSDANGYQVNGTTIDGAGGSVTNNTDLGNGYQYLTAYNGSYQSGGTTFDTLGVFGVATVAADMPTSGNATMTGEAELVAVSQNAGITFLTDGTATITADFGAGLVSISLDSFTALASNGTAASNTPFTELNVSNMSIAGNGFSGGTVSVLNGNTAADVTGANTVHASQGVFYGYDANTTNPAEVGGVLQVVGDTGVVSGIYVAN